MIFFSNIRKRYASLSHSTSVGLLLIMPKCSLCVFTVGSSIAVCGFKPVGNPIWEYFFIGFFSVVPMVIMVYEMRKGWRILPILIVASGFTVLLGFLLLDLSSAYYYVAVVLLSSGWIVLKIQHSFTCRHG